MTDSVWKRNEIDSPCVDICVIDRETKLCLGCRRTGDEIARWSIMSPQERRDIMATLPDREPQVKKRRGGRSARLAKDRRDMQG